MKHLIISISVIFFLASLSLVPAYAQLPNLSLYQAAVKTQYELKLEVGKQYYIQTITEQKISDPTPAKEGSMAMTIGTGAKLDVSNIDANGNAQVTYTYKWIKFGIKGKEIEEKVYDSSKKDSTVPEEFQWFAPLLEESFTLKISPEGRISEIKDLEKVRSNVQQKLPQGPTQGIAMSSLNQWLDEQILRESIENSLAIYPDKPVGVGDSWSRNVTYSSGSAMILESKWTLKERKNGVAVIEVASTIKPNPQAKPTEMGQGITSSSEFTGNQQGLIEMQESTGLIIRSKINQQMSGQNKITRPGVSDTVTPMEITGVVSMETSDWEKARSILGTNAVTEGQSRREIPYSRPENFQRRTSTYARSAAQPYLIDDEKEFVPARPRPGQTAPISLHQAVANGDIEQVKLLISKGADVNSRNRLNGTPLHIAVQYRRQALIELLIDKGTDVNAKDSNGQTALRFALDTGQKGVIELLIAKGADVNAMDNRGENALSMAKRRQQTEIVELLLKHGAKEPSPEDLMRDRYSGERGGLNMYPGYGEQGTIQRGTRVIRGTRTVGQSPVQVDILADPNEIRVRVKTFEGLEKALEEIAGKSQSEMRQWQQKRYDNKTMLIRTLQKQFEDEIGFIRKAAVDEEAKKTTAAIDSMLPKRQERFKKVSKELLIQRREQRQMESTRGRGRTRTTGRSTRGRTSQRGQQYGSDMTDPYGGRGDVMSRTTRPQSTRRPTEQVDMETENEINQWLQAGFEDKTNLAEAVHQQLRLEIESVRGVAVEEQAKKTTAAIDGLLLYRQMRFEAYISKMGEEQQTLRQQTQDPRLRGRGRYPQDGQMQQQNQPGIRGRRR